MNRKTLSAGQIRAMFCLLECKSIQDAAKHSRVGYSSLRKWLEQDELFNSEYEKLKQEMYSQSMNRMLHIYSKAQDYLSDVLDGKVEKATVGQKIFACQIITSNCKPASIGKPENQDGGRDQRPDYNRVLEMAGYREN